MARSSATQVAYAAAAWPAANRAIYVPVWFPTSVTLLDLRVTFTTAVGNYDLGLYDANFDVIEAKGTTACSAAAHTLTLTKPQRIRAGWTVYAGLVLSSTSDSTFRSTVSSVWMPPIGLAQEALGSTSLPSTATPVAPASDYLPLFAFGLR